MRKFNVNQIREALEGRFKIKIVSIEEVYVASIKNQRSPRLERIGVGGVLTVCCEVDE